MKRKCWICGNEYDFCVPCHERGSWKAVACSHGHYQILTIIREYREGIINAKEATMMFANIGITADTELDCLSEVTSRIKSIIAEGTPKKVVKKKSEEISEEE